MSNPNDTEPVQPLTGARLKAELARRLTDEYQREAVAAYKQAAADYSRYPVAADDDEAKACDALCAAWVGLRTLADMLEAGRRDVDPVVVVRDVADQVEWAISLLSPGIVARTHPDKVGA